MDDKKLIATVRSRTCIYEKADANHFNREIVAAAWENVAQEVGSDVTPTDCKSRWVYIRDYFLKKYRESRISTSGQAAGKKKKWHIYDFLLFLIPSCSTGTTSGNLPDNDEDSSSGDERAPESPVSVPVEENTLSGQFRKPPRHPKRKGQSATISAINIEILKALKEPETQQVDDNELFFKSLLLKRLDGMHTMQFRLEVQQLLLTFLKSAHSNATGLVASPIRIMTPPQASTSVLNYQHNEVSQNVTYYHKDQYLSQNEFT